ncbi:sentrin-specific protease 8 isoform X3 [Eurytemora carolleeae]|uniref:sentrin-specific protease 8 isoform X3 n=1 Tax=Eurytemora carolleeae TaxID=1294199 RepID=UPI000C76D29B|nr:sentrin-specific protease 8 isoform X3 [Eurytemora carolleeae]|eukprot:XP_023322213.1 sentrin-specific protease 8-like isoform X3 [Eurytemora affinis]
MSSILLSYGDALIRQSDLELLLSKGWINDQLIGFYLEYLQEEKYKTNPEILLVGAEVGQIIKLVDKTEVPGILEPLGFSTKDLVLFPVNSLNNPEVAGGSHWSLLVYCKSGEKFYHFDSASSFNKTEAEGLAKNLGKLTR